MRTNTLAEALAIENANPYGNAASVFTQNGGIARHVAEHASAGMVGINIGVPVPREPFSFGGWNESKIWCPGYYRQKFHRVLDEAEKKLRPSGTRKQASTG